MKPIDAVFFFGTGTVINAWEPVLRALAKKYRTGLGQDAQGQDLAARWSRLDGNNNPCNSLDRELANWVFGVRVGLARYYASYPTPQRPAVQRDNDRMRAELLDLKKTIASELLKAQKSGETRLREDTVAAAATHAGEGPSEILTANWDQTLERWLKANGKRPKVFHVHGSIKKPSTMLLPGEAPWDIHRDKADNAYFRKTYEVAMGHFAFARRIYVAGLGLSPSDAALGTALNEGLQARGRVAGSSKEPGEVVVVNLKKDMERIVAQVRMLVPDGWTLREESVG